jgi:hypothetical protein
MRELYKNSRYELSKWKEYFEPNESVLKGKSILFHI